MSTDTQNNAPVIAEAFSIPAALREIASWMDSGGPTYHEAELIGMNIAGPTGCGAHKECTRAAKLAFLEAARIWERLHPSSPVGAEPVLRIGTDRNGELAIFTPRFNSVIARFTPCGKSGMKEGLLYSAPVAAQPDLTQQTLNDVMAGIPTRDAEIEALRKEIETLRAQQDADKVDAALAEMVHAMLRSGNSVPVTRITIDRKQYDAAIDAARKEQA
ncbi:hypothetical protein [Alcaligenes aquatilis]|uniref:hypothetical protein n=1 Tax=Alcaligenes aquatilis TaxID=323284 RepID=UPI003F8E4883